MTGLIDAGVNLASSQFRPDRDQVLQRARQADIDHIISIGCDIESSRLGIALSQQYRDYVSSTAGIHPHNADGANSAALTILGQLAQDPYVVAIGETGLDYNRNFSTPANQRSAFAAQLEIAAQSGKPVYLHERDAFRDQIEILTNYRDALSGGLAHCFTGDREQARAWLELGLHIGITGWLCDPRRAEQLRNAVHYIPLDRIILETDAPYLLPRQLAPDAAEIPVKRRNEPCLLPSIAAFLAELVHVSPDQLARTSSENARALFNLPSPAPRHSG